MNLAQLITDYSSLQSSNNFYCDIKSIPLDNLSHIKSSKTKLSTSSKVIAFGTTQLNFIPTKIKNSISEAVVVSTMDDRNIFADFINEWIRKHKDRNHRSFFYKKVFKSLLHQKVRVVTSPISASELKKQRNILLSQRFIWGANLEPSAILSYFRNKKTLESSNVSNKFLIDQLSASPVFVVKNGFNEIILGYPQSSIKRGSVNHISSSNLSLLNHSNPICPASTGLFFFHPDDAFEFKDFIKSVNPLSAKNLEIDVEPVGLHFAYKMNRNLSSGTQFSFIPDFKEVGDLIFKHQKDKHLVFHKHQHYGKNFFQGQPIYIIQPIHVTDQNGNQRIVKFTGLNDDREVIFTNLEAANKSWTNFIKNHSELASVKRPNLLVYNLESFLKDKERLHKKGFQKFVVITSKDAYITTKELQAVQYSNSLFKHLKLNIKPKLFFLKLWVRRLIFALTYE